MRVVLVFAITLALCNAQRQIRQGFQSPRPFSLSQSRQQSSSSDGSGRYVHDRSGDYDPYRYDSSGKYIHDDSGQYRVVGGNDGRYDPDRFGEKKIQGVSQTGFGGVQPGGSRFGAGTTGFGQTPFDQGGFSGTQIGTGLESGFATAPAAQSAPSFDNFGSQKFGSSNGFGNGFGNGFAQSASSTQGKTSDGGWKILRQEQNIDEDGYHYLYDTENKISVEERGKLYNRGTPEEALRATGFFQFTAPDNQLYRVDYTADEGGFQAQGDHLPTPPPTPEAILRSLEYIKSKGVQ